MHLLSQRKTVMIGIAFILFSVISVSMVWKLASFDLLQQLIAVGGIACGEVALLVGIYLVPKQARQSRLPR